MQLDISSLGLERITASNRHWQALTPPQQIRGKGSGDFATPSRPTKCSRSRAACQLSLCSGSDRTVMAFPFRTSAPYSSWHTPRIWLFDCGMNAGSSTPTQRVDGLRVGAPKSTPPVASQRILLQSSITTQTPHSYNDDGLVGLTH